MGRAAGHGEAPRNLKGCMRAVGENGKRGRVRGGDYIGFGEVSFVPSAPSRRSPLFH